MHNKYDLKDVYLLGSLIYNDKEWFLLEIKLNFINI